MKVTIILALRNYVLAISRMYIAPQLCVCSDGFSQTVDVVFHAFL